MAKTIKYAVCCLVMMMILSSSCMAVKKRALVVVERHEQEQPQQERVDVDDVAYPGSSVNNHHYIPRPDFDNNYGGNTGATIDGCGRACG